MCKSFKTPLECNIFIAILGLQSTSRDVTDNVSHPRRLDPTMKLITYSFVLYLQHGRHDVKCKPSIAQIYMIYLLLGKLVWSSLCIIFYTLSSGGVFTKRTKWGFTVEYPTLGWITKIKKGICITANAILISAARLFKYLAVSIYLKKQC